MIILSIETSCDETAISVIKATGGAKKPSFSILANNVASQIKLHAQYGGVFPMMAKREHAKNITPLLAKTLTEAKMLKKSKKGAVVPARTQKKISDLLAREEGLADAIQAKLFPLTAPKIDMIAVTIGPGLEPALWVGLNFAKALSLLWGIPLMPINHMEGHVVSALLKPKQAAHGLGAQTINTISFPALALLISGGHTELALVRDWGAYALIGQTKDDAAGEAFDKVARMLDLPYPGGPALSKLAAQAKGNHDFSFPRPMLGTDDFDFSFSGLKTAVLYHIQKKDTLSDSDKIAIAREFQDAVTEVLVKKTFKAVAKHKVKTLLLGGGVAANTHIRNEIEKKRDTDFPDLKLYFPRPDLSTDNALMIGIAAYFRSLKKKRLPSLSSLKAQGNLKLS